MIFYYFQKLIHKLSDFFWGMTRTGLVFSSDSASFINMEEESKTSLTVKEEARDDDDHSSIWTSFVFPGLLFMLSPHFIMLLWYINFYHAGSLQAFGKEVSADGLLSVLLRTWVVQWEHVPLAAYYLSIFILLQWTLSILLPGRAIKGPPTAEGECPTYKCNGMACFLVTLIIFLFASFHYSLLRPAWFYDHFGALLICLNIFGCCLSSILYIKAALNGSKSNGNVVLDYFWGRELNPRLFGCDVKVFTNCRMGMTLWALLILCFAHKQYEKYDVLSDSMTVSLSLQLIYILKFFHWYAGYFSSIDIAHDRAGYYICWGCTVWVPGLYTSVVFYLAEHANMLEIPVAAVLLAIGLAGIIVTMSADEQKQILRQTSGDCYIWGKRAEYITANYSLDGQEPKRQRSLLLISGWWGCSRHFHYLTEWTAALAWSLPALFVHVLPYSYVIFLAILLLHRTYRTETRCARKYGYDWEEYCKRVPYVLIPHLF